MIVCHPYRFIFLKTRKTAGTSIEIALSRHCGATDIITPLLAPSDEDIRKRLGYRGPQGYAVMRNGVGNLGAHAPACVVKQLFPQAWQSYFKFAVVRNPWQVCVSAYSMRAAYGEHRGLGFSDYIASADFAARASKWREVYLIDGRIAADHICRYESLERELESLRLRIGLPEPLALPHAKSGHRTQHYREIVTERDAQVIAKLFAPEIELFGYEY